MGAFIGFICGLIVGWQFYYGEKMVRQNTEEINERLKKDIEFWQKYSRKLEKKIYNEDSEEVQD